jgi:hypothetical protein
MQRRALSGAQQSAHAEPYFVALCSFVQLQEMQFTQAIVNVYQWKTELFTNVVAAFVAGFILGKEHLSPQFRAVVNA